MRVTLGGAGDQRREPEGRAPALPRQRRLLIRAGHENVNVPQPLDLGETAAQRGERIVALLDAGQRRRHEFAGEAGGAVQFGAHARGGVQHQQADAEREAGGERRAEQRQQPGAQRQSLQHGDPPLQCAATLRKGSARSIRPGASSEASRNEAS